MIGNSNDKTNFPHKLLSTNTQVSKIRSSANIKFSKTQFSKMIDLNAAIPQVMFLTGKEVLKKGISLASKLAPKLAGKATNEFNKKFTSSKRSRITQL